MGSCKRFRGQETELFADQPERPGFGYIFFFRWPLRTIQVVQAIGRYVGQAIPLRFKYNSKNRLLLYLQQ